MNSRRFCLQKGGSQEYIYLITIMFCFNEFAFTVQVKHKINSIQILGLFWYVCILRLVISTHVYFAKNVTYFPFNSWLSFQRLCRLLWGYHIHFVDSIMLQIILWFLSLYEGKCKWSYGPSCPVDFPLNIFIHSFIYSFTSWHVCLFWSPRRRQPPRCIGLFNW